MKIKNIFVTLFVILLFVWSESGVLAMTTGFSTEKMDSKDQQIFLSNINISIIDEEPPKSTIKCFDVNDNGLIAIGSGNSTKKSICIYTSDGIFNYGYIFNCSGDFGIEWDGDNLVIYFVRSDVAASFNAEGTSIELKKIQDSIDNNSYWNDSVYSTRRTVGGYQYIVKNNMGIFNIVASSYSQLIKTDIEGKVTIVYDVSTTHTIKTVILFVGILLFIAVVVSIIIYRSIKIKRYS